jgi:hypothetical protein
LVSGLATSQAPSYKNTLAAIAEKKLDLSERYLAARSTSLRNTLLKEASELLEIELVQKIFPAWYGTKWDFNGYSETPKVGVIACGYFVSTTLRDMGFQLNRFRIAQLYSHDIVKRVSGSSKQFDTLDKMLQQLLKEEDQLYVVGLDQHVDQEVASWPKILGLLGHALGRLGFKHLKAPLGVS